VGVKATLIVQLLPEESARIQVFCTTEKSPAVVMLATARGAEKFEEFVNVTNWTLLVVPTVCAANVRLGGDRAPTACATTGPLVVMVSGLSGALSVIVTTPELPPGMPTASTNVTLIVQLAPTAIDPTQLSDSVKLLLPTMLVMVSTAVPEFVSVTAWGAPGTMNESDASDSMTAAPDVGVVVVAGGLDE
jgi:hypothetical protein